MSDDDLDVRLRSSQEFAVRWFKDEKSYGRITADDGEVLFVHFS